MMKCKLLLLRTKPTKNLYEPNLFLYIHTNPTETLYDNELSSAKYKAFKSFFLLKVLWCSLVVHSALFRESPSPPADYYMYVSYSSALIITAATTILPESLENITALSFNLN